MKKRKRPTSWGLMTRPGEGSSIHDEVELGLAVATEIDFRWTYVGGSRQCIDDVLGDERLEALPATPEQRADELSDRINLPVER